MLFVKVLPVVFVLSCLYIICIPRTYTTDCRLAPEINSSSGGGFLGSLASNLGIDFSDANTTDAITPMLYPDLMEDSRFVVGLFPIMVTKADRSLQAPYGDYLRYHQDFPWWSACMRWLIGLLKSDDSGGDGSEGLEQSPYVLTKGDFDLATAIRSRISLAMDKKTGVITVSVEDQDPYVCKTLADSVSVHLQQFITDYRTNKARVDLEFYQHMVDEVKTEYDSIRRVYNEMIDADNNVVMQYYKSRQEDTAAELQRVQQKYSTMCNMLDQAVVKVQERTPVFTILKGADMPLKAAKPKRMIFVIGMCFLAFLGTIAYIFKDYVKKAVAI